MEVKQAIEAINQGKIAPLYLLKGSDVHLQNQVISALRKAIVQDELGEIRYDLIDQPLSEVMLEAETVSFFADHKLLIIEHPTFLTGEKANVEHQVDELLTYIDQPTSGTTLVFLIPDKMDERKKIAKALKKAGVVIDLTLSEKEVRRYIQTKLKEEGQSIQPQALDYLLDLTQYDLTSAMQELQKIKLYTLDQPGPITYELVDELVSKSLEQSLFTMTDYVLNQEAGKAIAFYHDLLLQGEDTIKIIYILAMQFRLLLQVKILQQRGYQQKEMASLLKIHPYRVKLALQHVRHLSLKQLGSIYDQFVEADYALKTSQLDQELIFEFLILRVISDSHH